MAYAVSPSSQMSPSQQPSLQLLDMTYQCTSIELHAIWVAGTAGWRPNVSGTAPSTYTAESRSEEKQVLGWVGKIISDRCAGVIPVGKQKTSG